MRGRPCVDDRAAARCQFPASSGGDCFVTPFLAMTSAGRVLENVISSEARNPLYVACAGSIDSNS